MNNFDLLRILAACQVVGVHVFRHMQIATPSWWPWFEAFPGVPIFFVISGFLISASFERSTSLESYTRNRFLRIYPGLWCCILLTIPVAIYFGSDFFSREAPMWLIAQLVGLIYTPDFLSGFGFGSYNGSLWTIPIELQFYFVLPIAYWIASKGRNPTARFWWLWGLFTLTALVFRWLYPEIGNDSEARNLKLVRYSFVTQIYLFLWGVLLQRMHLYRHRLIAGKALHWLIAYLLIVALVRTGEPFPAIVYACIYSGCMLMVGIVTIAAAYTLPGTSHRLLRGNDVSYGVYIYHGLIINILVELGMVGQIRNVVWLFAATFIAAFISWRLVERPFLRRKKQTIAAPAALNP